MTVGDDRIGLTFAGYGRPALDALAALVGRAKGPDPLSPVTVVVPNNFVGVSTRRALASGAHGLTGGPGPGVAGIAFLTPYRLAEMLGSAALASTGRRPVSTAVIAGAIRRVLSEQPGVFAPVSDHPTTEKRLVRTHRELSDVDEDGLDALAMAGARAREVIRIHRTVRSILEPQWYSEQDLVDAAIDVLGRELPRDDIGSLIVFLPDDLSRPMARLVVAAGRSYPTHVVAAATGHADADASLERSLTLLGLGLPALAPYALPSTRSTSFSDPDDEVRHVVRDVLAAAAGGVPFDAMAIVYGTDRPYGRLLHDHLTAASVPFNGAAVTGLEASITGRALLRLLALADRTFRREDVLGMVASLPLKWRNRPVPSRAWEMVSRDAGVVRGLDDWRFRLDRHRIDLMAEAALIADDPDEQWRVRRLTTAAEQASELMAFVENLDETLDAGDECRTWSDRVAWSRRVLNEHLGTMQQWPESELSAAERVDAVLERLTGLDTLGDECTTPIFTRTLSTELESGLGRVGRLGNGVLIGRAASVTGLALRRIWILGLAEGTFPSRRVEDSLLPDRDRVLTGGQLALERDRVGLEHRQLLAAVAAVAPDGTAGLSRARGDMRSSTERAPSRWLETLVADPGDPESPERPGTEQSVASFAGGIATTTFPATIQEHAMQALVLDPATEQHLTDDPDFAASLEATRARHRDVFSRFDGKVPRDLVPAPTRRPMSATALETWARCPHAYFARYLLGVHPVEAPEARFRIDPLSRGSLVHSILERFVSEQTGQTSPRLWNEADRQRLLEIAQNHFDEVEAKGLTGAALYWRRDRTLLTRDLLTFVELDNQRRSEGGLRPLAVELEFGDDTAPVWVDLGRESKLRIRGIIDRVDESAEGVLHVVDYKSGRAFNVSEDDPHAGGTRLQLVLYAHAARSLLGRPDAEVVSSYWFVTARAGFKEVGYRVGDRIAHSVDAAVASIVAQIGAGVFPQHPDPTERVGEYVPCPYCDPDGLGTRDARRRFQTLSSTAELHDYVALAEPRLLPDATLTEPAERRP